MVQNRESPGWLHSPGVDASVWQMTSLLQATTTLELCIFFPSANKETSVIVWESL